MQKLRVLISQMAYGIYGLLFGFVFYRAMFNNTSFRYDTNILIKIMTGAGLYLIILLFVYNKFSEFFYRHRYKILILMCICIFGIQYTIGNNVVHSAIYDHEKVLHGAMMWAQGMTGEEFIPYDNYLHYYTNNLGLFMIQQLIFRVALFLGFTNLYTVAIFTGHLIFTSMIIASFVYLDENISGHRALFFLMTICMYRPLYFQSSISYTDTYSVWGIPFMLLFISRGINTEKLWKKMIYAIISAIFMVVGVHIKTTVAIVVIALFIQTVVNNLKINNMAFFAVMLTCFVVGHNCFNNWTYTTVRHPDRDSEAMPLTHWIMMGLQGDGAYNGEDEHRITLSVPPGMRVDKNIEVIKQRLEDMGPEGYLKLLYRKTCRTFGSGNAEVYYTYKYHESDSTPFNFVYESTLENGKYYPYFNYASQAVYLTAILLGIIGAVLSIFRKYNFEKFAPNVALIGFWLFMMLWESNHRQLINQWSLFFILAATGLYNLWQIFFERKEIKSEKTEKDKVF